MQVLDHDVAFCEKTSGNGAGSIYRGASADEQRSIECIAGGFKIRSGR